MLTQKFISFSCTSDQKFFKKMFFSTQDKNFSKLAKTFLLQSEVKMYYKMTPIFNYKVMHEYYKVVQNNVETFVKQRQFFFN